MIIVVLVLIFIEPGFMLIANMQERLTGTADGIESEHPKLMTDFLLDRMLEHEPAAEDAVVMYQVLTDCEESKEDRASTVTTPGGQTDPALPLKLTRWWRHTSMASSVFGMVLILAIMLGGLILVAQILAPHYTNRSYQSGLDYADRHVDALGLRVLAAGPDSSNPAVRRAIADSCTAAVNSAGTLGADDGNTKDRAAWLSGCFDGAVFDLNVPPSRNE